MCDSEVESSRQAGDVEWSTAETRMEVVLKFLVKRPSKTKVDGKDVLDYENLADVLTDEIEDQVKSTLPKEVFEGMTVSKASRGKFADALFHHYLESLKHFPVENIKDFVTCLNIEENMTAIATLDSDVKLEQAAVFMREQKELQTQLISAIKSATKESFQNSTRASVPHRSLFRGVQFFDSQSFSDRVSTKLGRIFFL